MPHPEDDPPAAPAAPSGRPASPREQAIAASALYTEYAAQLERYQALLAEDQAMREAEYEHPDPARRRLRVMCNGCTTPFCCNQRVDVGLVEAMVLLRWAAKHARPQLEEALRRGHELHSWRPRRPHEKALDIEAFFRRRIPCAFLVKGRCSVYPVRPWSCRTHYMAGNPLKCRDELQPSETYAMDPDPSLLTELRTIADDVTFFAQIEGVVPVELSEVLHLVDKLLPLAPFAEPVTLDWPLVGE